MAGLWPALRRFGSDFRKFAESDKIDKYLRLGVYGTIFWSGMNLKRRHDAAEAADAAQAAQSAAQSAAQAAADAEDFAIWKKKKMNWNDDTNTDDAAQRAADVEALAIWMKKLNLDDDI